VFDNPPTWKNEFDSEYEAQLNNFVVALADLSNTTTYRSTIFQVNVSDVHKYLDDGLQKKAATVEIMPEIKSRQKTKWMKKLTIS
jgi:hypothetical protein